MCCHLLIKSATGTKIAMRWNGKKRRRNTILGFLFLRASP